MIFFFRDHPRQIFQDTQAGQADLSGQLQREGEKSGTQQEQFETHQENLREALRQLSADTQRQSENIGAGYGTFADRYHGFSEYANPIFTKQRADMAQYAQDAKDYAEKILLKSEGLCGLCGKCDHCVFWKSMRYRCKYFVKSQ